MKAIKHINYEYPKIPNAHMLRVRYKKRKTHVGADYKFVNKNCFFRAGSAMMRAAVLVFFPIWSILMRTKIKGRKHLRAVKKQGVVIVCNHVHPLDAVNICARLSRKRKVRIVVLKENIDLPVSGRVIRLLGAIPLSDNYGGQKQFTRTVDGLLQNKKPVLFFPEAALWPYYTALRPFSIGGFSFAARNNVPLLPMVYTFKLNRKGKKRRLILNVLPPVYPDDRTAKELCETTHRQMLEAMQRFYSDAKNNKSGRQPDLLFKESEISC